MSCGNKDLARIGVRPFKTPAEPIHFSAVNSSPSYPGGGGDVDAANSAAPGDTAGAGGAGASAPEAQEKNAGQTITTTGRHIKGDKLYNQYITSVTITSTKGDGMCQGVGQATRSATKSQVARCTTAVVVGHGTSGLKRKTSSPTVWFCGQDTLTHVPNVEVTRRRE